jgi:hypothetical protein
MVAILAQFQDCCSKKSNLISTTSNTKSFIKLQHQTTVLNIKLGTKILQSFIQIFIQINRCNVKTIREINLESKINSMFELSLKMFVIRRKTRRNQVNQKSYLDDPIRMYACHGKDPNPASSPPTIRRCAVCFANETPQPENRRENH